MTGKKPKRGGKQKTQIGRTLKELRQLGHLAAVVEKYNHHVKRKQDLFGLFDVLAIHAGLGIVLLVQVTSVTNISTHLRTIRSSPNTDIVLAAGCTVELWAWEKRGAHWQVRIIDIPRTDLDPRELDPRPRRGKRAKQGSLFG